MTGSIVQVNSSPGGFRSELLSSGMLTPLGLAGDACAHPQIHGGPTQAVLLYRSEVVDELKTRGYPLFYGALGENLTTRGLDRCQLRIGQQLRAGGALLEITKVRGPCAALDVYGPSIKREIYDKQVKPATQFATLGNERLLCTRFAARPRTSGRYNRFSGHVA